MGKIIKNGLEYGDTSLPSGGKEDQVLAKKSSLDNDVEWKDTGLSTEDWSDIMTPLPGQPTEGIIISPEERQVGWYYNMDGSGTKKPIYRKCFEFGALTDTTSIAYLTYQSVGASVDKYVNVFGVCRGSAGWVTSIPMANTKDAHHIMPSVFDNTYTGSEKNKVSIAYFGSLSWITSSYLIVEYTKTTDTYA